MPVLPPSIPLAASRRDALVVAAVLALSGPSVALAEHDAWADQRADLPAEQAEAVEALARAELAVAKARAHDALWTTAFDALKAARAARATDDPAATLSAAQRAQTLAQRGLEQAARSDSR
jgi:hypothetical protein